MPFSSYKSVDQVLREYSLKFHQKAFMVENRLDFPELIADNIRFAIERRTPNENEVFYTENFIYPLLQQAWKRRPKLQLWSHRTLNCDEKLNGEPDYLVSAWPEGGVSQFVQSPFLAVVEAKKQDFDEGWGQCLAAMLACQKLNVNHQPTAVYGIVSTGLQWEFGMLSHATFTKNPIVYSINDPNLIFGLLDHLFAECEKQANEL